MLNAGMVLRDRYEIVGFIGKGGMSTVYQARDLKTNNLLAIKDVNRSGLEENQEVEQKLAVSEGRMLEQLSNPHLPKIYEIIETSGSFMIVMDYIQGESLDKVIQRTGAQPVEQVLNWGMQICEVFHYLHNQPTPVIYRDMKPANIMLRPDGQLMMIDFGTARTLKNNQNMTEDTICMGTAGFAAPEQFGGSGQSDVRTDIFCLGGTLYNMVTGHSPCDKPTGILPLEYWNPALANSPISEIIYKCTRNDPNERYQTAMELYEDLRLASTGAYKKKGKSGQLGFRTGDWQKQDHRGAGMINSGLSSLIQRGLSERTSGSQTAAAPAQPAKTGHTGGWQQSPVTAASQQQIPAHQQPQEAVQTPADHEEEHRWKTLSLIAVAIALVMLVMTVVSALLQQTALAMIFLIVAVGAAVLAVVGIIFLKRIS